MRYALIALAALCVALGLSTWQYKRMYAATNFALKTQNDAIQARNEEANRKLKTLTEAKDAEQTRYNTLVTEQEIKDTQHAQYVKDLKKQLDPGQLAPAFRVRVASCAAGGGGGGAAGRVPAGAPVGQVPQAAATGLLPEPNSRRLAERLIEVEELSGDFNTCQADLLAREEKK